MAFPFSSKTVGFLIDAIVDGYTGANMGTLFLKAGVDQWLPASHSNKEDRAQKLLAAIRSDASPQAAGGAFELTRLVLVHGKGGGYAQPSPWWQPLKDSLAADGWDFDVQSDSFVAVVPGTQMLAEVTWIGDELRRRGWSVPKGHYDQAVDSFGDGRWAAANGQLRTFFESLIRTAGGTTSGTSAGQVQAAIDKLNKQGHLLPDEADFAKSLWRMLHPHGSHPGLSDEDESRFRLLALTGYARFLLTRLP